jgi:hypothetical protein
MTVVRDFDTKIREKNILIPRIDSDDVKIP